jgi:sugar lactone lactonase YvrE
MNKILGFGFLALSLAACSSHHKDKVDDKKMAKAAKVEVVPVVEEVASFTGAQVTGVTATEDGRIFANFPRWRRGVINSVVEVMPDGTSKPYPDESWNKYTGSPSKNKFTCVQSVVAYKDSLFVLDPSNPLMEGVVGKAMLYEFDLKTNELKKSWSFDRSVAPENSYLNDLRVDDEANRIYITDSGLGAIVVLDRDNGKSWRVLDKDKSTKSESVVLKINDQAFLMRGRAPKMHSDGIAFNETERKLYYHALTGYHLYSVPADALNDPGRAVASEEVTDLGVTPAPDGMIFDKKGNLFMADLENHSIVYRTPAGEIKTLIQDENIQWPDSFTISGNDLIFTDSLLQMAKPGAEVEDLEFKIYKVPLPKASL